MEFWGAEVKSGKPLKVSLGNGMLLHLSQASIGELKKVKGNESVCLFVNVGGNKFVLGTLLTDKLPQQQFDLVFDKDFELSHNWKSGSVYFYGYQASNSVEEDDSSDEESDESESEEDIPLNLARKHEPKAKEQKSAEAANEKKSDAGKQKVSTSEIKNGSSDEDSMSEDDDEDDSENEDGSDESDESEEETPKKAEIIRKRPVESASKTPVPKKKAKTTPQKTDGKKGNVHVDTPYPAKAAGKTPANKPNQQTPKSGGSHSCKSCNRTFGSEKGLESHSKAKHGGGK